MWLPFALVLVKCFWFRGLLDDPCERLVAVGITLWGGDSERGYRGDTSSCACTAVHAIWPPQVCVLVVNSISASAAAGCTIHLNMASRRVFHFAKVSHFASVLTLWGGRISRSVWYTVNNARDIS